MHYHPYSYSHPQPYPYYYHPTLQPHYGYRQYPEVDETIFIHSVEAFQKIAREAITILNQFSNHTFAKKLMRAAQQGNQQEVDRLMKSIGVDTPITTTYTPSGVKLEIHANAQGSQCCTLTMFLRWGN
ncbi:hypothetical protein SAMN05192533_11280 [Mesobacillus persicus]|uniref:Inner spore coat protein n=1 Tax=Mesobacillus persicus TaxID=930146 RepID=A0A1H8G3J0_9BACI|nr:hypothetical protein [Mesobacillus persicus]SEN38651.1 hypothetical protein SAMN05192533_11280 [Mesobacillus persicus]